MPSPVRWIRRDVLTLGLGGFAAAALPSLAFADRPRSADRSLSLHNLHTGESLDVTYWADGRYIKDALAETNTVLRDFRTNEVARIDVGLLDLLHDLRLRLDTRAPYHVISGYRSPATNAMLAAKSRGVAKRSLHTRGMAVDVRVPGRDLRHVRRAAVKMKRGGVGFYGKSGFVHLDVGRPRYW